MDIHYVTDAILLSQYRSENRHLVLGFCCSSYKNKTTRTFEHRGEAWRVLVGAKVVLFIESSKLFDGKSFFDVDFVVFLSLMKKFLPR